MSTGTLHKMDTYFRTVPVQPPVAPRDLGPLISTLDDLGVDRVYADFWLAYRLTFDTDERIIAAQNKFTELRFEGGQAWRPDTRSSGIHRTRQKSRTPVTASSSSASRSIGEPTGVRESRHASAPSNCTAW